MRRLWKKFQPKLWLFFMLEKVSIRSRMKDLKTFLRKNIVSASVPIALGLCYLLLKLWKSRCNVAPYSSLLMGIQNGSVTRVEFEENSRRIFYNTKFPSKEKAEVESGKLVSRKNEFTSYANNDRAFKLQEMFANLLRRLSKKQDSVPGLHSKINAYKNKRELLNNQVADCLWSTTFIDIDYHALLDLLKESGTEFGVKPEPVLISMGKRGLTTVLNQAPFWAMLLLIARGLGGGSSIARKPSKEHAVTFDDVEGVDTAKIELMEVVKCLQGDDNYKNLGAKLPRGVLLVGPPGTGKTLLARAAFFITCASEFVEMFVGRGASRIRDLFKEARKCAPSIIFIDELDAVGLRRGRGFNTEGDQTLNQLLTEMDGFESDKKVVVIAATNRAEMLDPALLRPGRFSRKVFVEEPDEDGRRKILAVHFRGVPLEDDTGFICRLVASHTEGLVGADLANIVNEAALLAGRRGGKCVSKEDVMDAVQRAID